MNWLEDSVKKRKVSHSKWSVEKEMNDEFNRLSPMVTRLLHDMGEAEWGKTSPGHYLTNTSSCWILACAERVVQGYWRVEFKFNSDGKASHFVIGGEKLDKEGKIITPDISKSNLKKALAKAFERGPC